MDGLLRSDETRLTIKPSDSLASAGVLIPASVFQKTFNTFLAALKTADNELNEKGKRSAFVISDLRMGSNIVAFREQRQTGSRSSIDLLRNIAGSVYRSEFEKAASSPAMANAMVRIGAAINPSYPVVADFPSDTIPLDAFFSQQAKRLKAAMSGRAYVGLNFVGNAIVSFDGTMGNIDYRGATWKGHLLLGGQAGAQIECIFDKSKGEDFYNPFGNKRVSVTGRAIYTGDSQLPERIETITIEEFPLAKEHVDIRGSLTGKRYLGAGESGYTALQ